MSTKKITTTPKAKVKSTTPKTKKSSSTPVKKPSVKSATKKPTTRRKTTKPKRKEISHEEMFPFESFPFRLEYKDGNENRICHFQCKEHRTKYINRYRLKKSQYYIDDAA